MTANTGLVDVVYLHGVGGPSLDWHEHLPAHVANAVTVSFDDLMGRNVPAGPVRLPSADQTAWAQTYYQRRDVLASLVRETADRVGGTDGSQRWQPPVIVPTAALVRSPVFNMSDAAQYRRDPATRAAIADRTIAAIESCQRPVVLLAHSLGSVIAVDLLHDYPVQVDLLLTIGSPIGVDLDWCADWVGGRSFPTQRLGGWLNVINTRDPIPWNRAIEPRFPQAVDAFVSAGRLLLGPGGAHDPVTYLKTNVVQAAFDWVSHLS